MIPGNRIMNRAGLFVLIFALATGPGCNSPYTVKPRGYFKISFPEHRYQLFNSKGFPYTFEYPLYARIERDTSFFGDAPENPYWINVVFPRFNGKIYISYKAIGRNDFAKLVNDAFEMTYKHSSKAAGIEDSVMHTPQGVSGVFFNVAGNAATSKQFFVTDSVKHFLRGALYFDVAPNEDSLSIVNNFLQVDVKHLINTLKWR